MRSNKWRKQIAIPLCALFFGVVPCAASADEARLESSAVYREIKDDVLAIQEGLARIPIDVLSGKAKPGWSEFHQLEEVLNKILAIKNRFKDRPEAWKELTSLASDMRELTLSMPGLKASFDARAAYVQEDQYEPTEFELKLAFQTYLERINQELPQELRIPLKDLPVDKRRERLIQDAREYAAKTREVFASRFTTPQFSSYASFETYLRSSEDPTVKRAVEIVDKDQIRPVIRRPESARFWVPKTGFQNQFVTGSSRGSYGPSHRNNVESQLFEVESLETYQVRDAEFKPKYGTLMPKPESGLRSGSSIVYAYGTDIYGLKVSRVADRLSFTPDDSFAVYRGTAWDQMVIPWSHRLLMIPFFLRAVRHPESDGFDRPNPDETIPLGLGGGTYFYWEIQILGPVSLDDVDYFEFSGEPPSGDFLRELEARKIKIYDGREQPAKPWKEN